MTKFQRKLKIQLLVLSVIILTAIIGVIHTAVYVMSRNFTEYELSGSAQSIAAAVSQLISHDIAEYKNFVEKVNQYKASRGFAPMDIVDEPMPAELYANDPYYKKMQQALTKIKEDGCDIKYIYTDRRLDNDTFEFVLDAEPVGADDHSPPGSTEKEDGTRTYVCTTGNPARFGLTYYDQWGYLIGAHVPLYDDDGKILGVVGVNFCGSQLSQYLFRLQFFLCVVYAFIVGITLFIVTKYSFVIMEPLFKDRLTGAYTKRYADRLIQEEIALNAKASSQLALMVLDLDHFKKVNDTYGHNFGDKVLATLSETIQRVLRHKDYFIRYGGEEFIALVPEVDEDKSRDIAERIRTTVANTDIMNTEKNTAIKMTISIGIAVLDNPFTSAHEFIDQADKALYVAKQTRNCVAFYNQETEELIASAEESYMASSIRRNQSGIIRGQS